MEQLTISPLRAALWLTLSVLLAGVTTGVTKLIAPDLERPVRLARWVQLPYIGLILGGLSPRLMGLTGVDWTRGIRAGVVFLAALLTLLFLIRISLHAGRESPHDSENDGSSSVFLLVECGAQEFHWCFLRGAVWDILLLLPATLPSTQYWAVWAAAALSLPGIGIQPAPLSHRLMTALTLVITSGFFIYTHNFWLCLLLHLSIRVILHWRDPY